jgi:AraC family cel operon transcriptional repressor
MHTHDFPEIFWIETGPVRHQINGEEQQLETGDIVFIRPPDRHQFHTIGRRRFIKVNLECHPTRMEEIKKRHPKPFAAWFDPRPRLPWKMQLSSDRLQHLQQMALDFANDEPDALHFEAFLLNLARLLEFSGPKLNGISKAPDWLQKALLEVQRPELLLMGVAGLVGVARRSPEHVARVCKASLQKTPTAVMEEFRMTYAERELRMSAKSVTDIALSCGYSTTTQFFRAFRRRYLRSPLRYRRWLAGEERSAKRGPKVSRVAPAPF